MKSLKKLVGGLILSAGMLLGTAFNANAIVITQEILFGGDFWGEVSFEMSSKQFNSGDIIDSAFDPNVNFVDATHFFGGFGTSEIFEFTVVFDTFFGVTEYLSLDAIDDDLVEPWGYQYLIDPFFGLGFLDIDDGTDFLFFFDNMSFGEVSVNTPATIALFTLAIAGVFAARRRS